MSWSVGYDDNWKRDIGYGVPAYCDHPGCGTEINRGLSHVCGGEPHGGELGCGLYFCGIHLSGEPQRCSRCNRDLKPYYPTPDHPDWLSHKATDVSWGPWREEQKHKSEEPKAKQ